MISHYKGIFLDLDDTLYNYKICNEEAKKKLFLFLNQQLNRPENDIQSAYDLAREQVHKDLEGTGASHSRLLYIQKTIEKLSNKTHHKLTLEAHEVFWEEFLRNMQLNSGVKQFLQDAKTKGIVLAIVTDLTAHIQVRKIIQLGIDPYIDFLITSEEAGREKPETNIFRLALTKTKLKSEEVIMIGDSQEKDIEGAKKIGIRAIHFHSKNTDDFASILHEIEKLH